MPLTRWQGGCCNSADLMHRHHNVVLSFFCDFIHLVPSKKSIPVQEYRSRLFSAMFNRYMSQHHLDGFYNHVVEIEDGCEWLAFTFQHQDMVFDEKHWEQMLDFSEHQLEDAYSRMEMNVQGWTKFTPHEIDFVEKACGLRKDSLILDAGCGAGRHSIELAKRGYRHLTAYDFSPRLLAQAEWF